MHTPKMILPEVHSHIEERLELFESIISLMNGHISIEKTLTLQQLADYAGYCRSYFYRNFMTEIGSLP